MDRFVWFVLLVVMSHLVTEFTRVTGNTRGGSIRNEPNALVNNSMPQGKQVQSLVFFPAPGHEYASYYQQQQQQQQLHQQQQAYLQPQAAYVNSNNHKNNMQTNGYNAPLVLPPATNFGNGGGINGISGGIGAGIATNGGNNGQNNAATTTAAAAVTGFSLRPLIDSIFDIPISTLRAVNNLVARLTGSYQHQSTPGGAAKSSSTSSSSDSIVGLVKAPMARVGLLAALAAEENAAAMAVAEATAPTASSATTTTTITTSKAAKKTSLLREVNA